MGLIFRRSTVHALKEGLLWNHSVCWSTTYKKTYCPTKCFTGPRPEEGLMWSWWVRWVRVFKEVLWYRTRGLEEGLLWINALTRFPPLGDPEEGFCTGVVVGSGPEESLLDLAIRKSTTLKMAYCETMCFQNQDLEEDLWRCLVFLVSVAPSEACCEDCYSCQSPEKGFLWGRFV